MLHDKLFQQGIIISFMATYLPLFYSRSVIGILLWMFFGKITTSFYFQRTYSLVPNNRKRKGEGLNKRMEGRESPTDNLNINKRGGGLKNVLGQKWQPVPLSLIMGVPNNYL